MKNMKVCKFGGSSLTERADIDRIKGILRDDDSRRVVVVSAPGKARGSQDKKVTDMLVELGEKDDYFLRKEILGRYARLFQMTPRPSLMAKLDARIASERDEGYVDRLKAYGEELCARLLARELGEEAEYVNPSELFVVTGDFSNAKILPESRERIRKRLDGKKIHVVPGFFGYTKNRQIATFSRGGSDLTGAEIASDVDAEVYENFTDTPGIYAAPPELIQDSRLIEIMTFEEIRDLAYSGFKVFHEEAMKPLAASQTPTHVRGTFEYPRQGTWVVADRLSEEQRPIVGFAYKGGLCSFDVSAFGLNGILGIARKMLEVLEKRGISIEYLPGAVDDLSLVFNQSQLNNHPNNVGSLIGELSDLFDEKNAVRFQDNLGSLVVAGKGLKGSIGMGARIWKTLADAGVNIKFTSQGPSERCIVFGIQNADRYKAAEAVYNDYIK